jgi:DNA replication protein DnaC
MNTTQTLQQLQQLRLQGMHQAYRSQLELPLNKQLDSHELIAHLTQTEELSRANEKTAYYLRLAKLRLPATLEQVEAGASRNLSKQQIGLFAEGSFLKQGENVLITGATGCGYVKQMIMQSILFNLLIINYTYLSYLALCF